MSTRPADECPYPRPFPPGFHDCPAYRSQRLLALDSRYRPLQPERTCQHLEVGTAPVAGRFYARCAIGTAADRRQWVDPERERLLTEAEALQEVMNARTGTLIEELVAIKGRQLRALSTPGEGRVAAAVTVELERMVGRYMVEIRVLLDEEDGRLDRLHLPRDSVLALLDEIFARWVPQRSLETPPIPDEVVERFPEQAWWLLRPRTPAR